MTTHIKHRTTDQPITNQTTIDHRPETTPSTTTTPATPPRRPLPRRLAPVGVAVAASVVGIGFLIDNANEQATPPAELVQTSTSSYMELYGTDNPTFVEGPTYMELYGTDNPVFIEVPAVVAERSVAGQTRGGLPDQLVEFEARTNAVEDGSAQRLIQETIDAALADRNVAATAGTGRLPQPGQPDGGVATIAPAANDGCKISGPC